MLTIARRGLFLLIALAAVGCASLVARPVATKSAKCEAYKGPPHRVRCWVDGELRYEQSGPVPLEVTTP